MVGSTTISRSIHSSVTGRCLERSVLTLVVIHSICEPSSGLRDKTTLELLAGRFGSTERLDPARTLQNSWFNFVAALVA